jgi:hypothetical protein
MNTECKTSDDDLSHVDARARIDIREGEGGSIIYKDPEGMEHEYHPATFASFVVDDIRVVVSLKEPSDGSPLPSIARTVQGTAHTLQSSLAIIGFPSTKAKKLNFTIEIGDWQPKIEPPQEIRRHHRYSFGGAMLGFSPGDDRWWMYCYLSRHLLGQLVEEISSGKVASMTFSVWIQGLYRDIYWGISPRMANLLVKPKNHEKDVDLLVGFVSWMQWQTAVEGPKDENDPTAVSLNPRAEASIESNQIDSISSAIAKLTAGVESMKNAVVWAVCLIVIALLFIAWR